MKTIERLKELQEVERRACGSSNMMRYVEAVGNTATAAHNALPALLAVVEAAERLNKSFNDGYDARRAGRNSYPESCRVVNDQKVLDAALRALEGGSEMGIQRYTCNIELLDECPHLEPLLKDQDGGYVKHSDHAAELARVERENTLLSAECEAWRAWWDAELPIDLNKPDMYQDVACARQATDAAGILRDGAKGAE